MKNKKSPLPLVQVTVIRPKRRFQFGNFSEALEMIRPWVGFGEAIRIFENTFRV